MFPAPGPHMGAGRGLQARSPRLAPSRASRERARSLAARDGEGGFVRGQMSMLHEALEFLGIAAGPPRHGRPGAGVATTRQEQRELAARMRVLPDRFAGRLSASARERVRSAAAVGRWEEAAEELLVALSARAEPVSAAERAELRAVLVALGMDGGRIEHLPQYH